MKGQALRKVSGLESIAVVLVAAAKAPNRIVPGPCIMKRMRLSILRRLTPLAKLLKVLRSRIRILVLLTNLRCHISLLTRRS
jgi:hypothetical protein